MRDHLVWQSIVFHDKGSWSDNYGIPGANLLGHLYYLLIRYRGASHILDRQRVSHDALVISYTSKRNQHCLSANNTDWNIHLQANNKRH